MAGVPNEERRDLRQPKFGMPVMRFVMRHASARNPGAATRAPVRPRVPDAAAATQVFTCVPQGHALISRHPGRARSRASPPNSVTVADLRRWNGLASRRGDDGTAAADHERSRAERGADQACDGEEGGCDEAGGFYKGDYGFDEGEDEEREARGEERRRRTVRQSQRDRRRMSARAMTPRRLVPGA